MAQFACGVDIGGTKLSLGLVDGAGNVLFSRATEEHTHLPEGPLLDLVATLVRETCHAAGVKESELRGVGVGMAGHINHRHGEVLTTSNLRGFKRFPLAAELAERLGPDVRVVLDNDANCQALAEHRYGAGKGWNDMVFITVSTGIGAGIVIGGRLYRGHSGTAGEIGHTIVEPHSDATCTCGNQGCLMAHACTLNLPALVKKKSVRFRRSSLLDGIDPDSLSGHDEGGRKHGRMAIDGKRVHAHAVQGDPLSREIVDEYAMYLSIMLYNIFQLLNPPCIVMGGGLMNWGQDFFASVVAGFHERAGAMLYDPIAIVPAGIHANAGVIGAALLLEEMV